MHEFQRHKAECGQLKTTSFETNSFKINYPEEAYFTYNDKTCDYECQVTEYFYWGMTSLLGAQQSPERLEQIQDEWRLNTPAKVEEGDPELFSLLTNQKYSLPTTLPDGPTTPAEGP